MHALSGLRIGCVDDVVAIDRESADATEREILADEPAILGQHLPAVVVTIGHHEPPLRIEFNCVRHTEFARAHAGLAEAAANLAIVPSALNREAYRVTVRVPELASEPSCAIGRTGRVIFDKAPAGAQ